MISLSVLRSPAGLIHAGLHETGCSQRSRRCDARRRSPFCSEKRAGLRPSGSHKAILSAGLNSHLIHGAVDAGSVQLLLGEQGVQQLHVVPSGHKDQRRLANWDDLPQEPHQPGQLVFIPAESQTFCSASLLPRLSALILATHAIAMSSTGSSCMWCLDSMKTSVGCAIGITSRRSSASLCSCLQSPCLPAEVRPIALAC